MSDDSTPFEPRLARRAAAPPLGRALALSLEPRAEHAQDQRTPMHKAARRDAAAVREAVAVGWKLDACDRGGNRPLNEAALAGNLETLRALLDAGAPINVGNSQTKRTALHDAALWGRADCVDELLRRGASARALDTSGRLPLHHLAINPETGGQPWADGLLSALSESGALLDVRDSRGRSPLRAASDAGAQNWIRRLANAGADFAREDDYGLTVVAAAATRHGGGLEELLAAARSAGWESCAVDSMGSGETPMHAAADAGCASGARVLMAWGADPNARGPGGDTPLHWAATSQAEGAGEVAHALCVAGASTRSVNALGLTPLALARGANGSKAAREVLEAMEEREALDGAATAAKATVRARSL